MLNSIKKQLVEHHNRMIDWVKSLNRFGSDLWVNPIEKEKWSSAEIISHLQAWDRFIMEKRIPYFFSEELFPLGPEVEEFNRKAAIEGRNMEQDDMIKKFVHTRQELLKRMESIDEGQWDKHWSINFSSS
ncbi:hypothetical protein LC087_06930 [Bacillus carboniphilus]|uniref:DinB-like domain-containing protein n=1 Tax=Bacillus carboniphilus TaxID=86663 RepID=A0ABY9JWT5_9BACI|nr:hypothetical protein [Bacillus carboniphilus]WLR43849.1 hypothetical protein LC087_06930 [Bacillus carboniphilus]